MSAGLTRLMPSQVIGGTIMNRKKCSMEVLPNARLKRNANKPIATVSITVITRLALTKWLYSFVLPLILGLIRPRWSIVARLPENTPPMPPRIVNIGGNSAKIQGALLKWGVNIDIRPPARRLMLLKERAIKVWNGIELKNRLFGLLSFNVAPWVVHRWFIWQGLHPSCFKLHIWS